MLIVLIVLLLLFGGIGWQGTGVYRTGGISLGAVILIVLVVYFIMGRGPYIW
jgi:hypothetical protein